MCGDNYGLWITPDSLDDACSLKVNRYFRNRIKEINSLHQLCGVSREVNEEKRHESLDRLEDDQDVASTILRECLVTDE